MRRTKMVLAAAALMVTMLVALAALAISDNVRNHNDNRHDNYHHNGWNNWDRHNDYNRFDNDRLFCTNRLYDDCEWEFEEGWFSGFWRWQWGMWFLDC